MLFMNRWNECRIGYVTLPPATDLIYFYLVECLEPSKESPGSFIQITLFVCPLQRCWLFLQAMPSSCEYAFFTLRLPHKTCTCMLSHDLEATERKYHEERQQQRHQDQGCSTCKSAPQNTRHDDHQNWKWDGKAATSFSLAAKNGCMVLGAKVVICQNTIVVQRLSVPY